MQEAENRARVSRWVNVAQIQRQRPDMIFFVLTDVKLHSFSQSILLMSVVFSQFHTSLNSQSKHICTLYNCTLNSIQEKH